MYRRYQGKAEFAAIYIREAHPTDEWQMESNEKEGVCYPQPKTTEQRLAIANDFTRRHDFPIPLLVDRIDNAADAVYAGWPERLYVIDEAGVIVYKGETGPFGFHPEEVEAWLAKQFGTVSISSRLRSSPHLAPEATSPERLWSEVGKLGVSEDGPSRAGAR